MNNSIRILSANLRGFRTNIGELTHSFVRKHQLDIVVTVETFLDRNCVTTCDRIPGYSHWIRRDRHEGQGGGIAVCHKDSLQMQLLQIQMPDMLEMMFFRIILADRGAALLCVTYRPQWQGSAPITFLTEHLDNIMATQNCQNCIIVGDLNQHLIQRAFTELTVVQGLANHVSFPTHIRGGSLDPVLTDLPEESVQCCQLDRIGSSDHNAILSKINLSPAREDDNPRVIWLWEQADWPAIQQALANTDWNTVLTGNVDQDVNTLTSTLTDLQQLHVPNRMYSTNSKDQPWFGYRCRVAADNKYRAWTRYKHHPTRHNKKLHNDACKLMSRTAEWAKRRWEQNLKHRINSNEVDAKQWWALVKARQGLITHERIPALDKGNQQLAISSQEKANLLASMFSSKMTTPDPNRQPPVLPRLCASSLQTLHLSEYTIKHHLKKINPKKATGPDEVSPRLLKNCANELSTPLTLIFQQCINSGSWPSKWKEARVVPVHKKNSKTDPQNYRPISLLSAINKIFESVIAEQLIAFLEEHHLLSPKQFGFMKGKSTADLLLLLSKSWHDNLDSGLATLVIALDIAGAFDCVWHQGLIAKLGQLGIAGDLLELLSNYLSDRSLSVVINGHTSSKFPVKASVPQGSVLGPILWNVYFNDLLSRIPTASAYADDCTLSRQFSRAETAEVITSTNQLLNSITEWGQRWQVKFAANKTQAMVISLSREDTRLLQGKLKFGEDILQLHDHI